MTRKKEEKVMALTTYAEAMDGAQEFTVFDPEGREYAGFWSDIRVDRDTLPEGWNAYDIRESDYDDDDDEEGDWLATIEDNYVVVNHAGTFLTQETLPLRDDGTGRKRACFGGDTSKGEWDYSFS